MSIADGVAGAIRSVVNGAMEIWNKFAPDSWKISDDDKKKFSGMAFEGVRDTIIAVIDFAKELADSFGAGFKSQLKGFGESWDKFKETFNKIVEAFKGSGVGDKAKGIPASTHTVGAAADIHCTESRQRALILCGLIEAGFSRIEIAKTFIHVDMADRLEGKDKKVEAVFWLY